MSDPSAAPPPRAPSRWPERLLLALGALLLGAGLLLVPLRRLATPPSHQGITGEVLPELAEASRIEAAPGALRDWNLLLITTDTTRADHLRGYGNRSVETPTLDRLAREGTLFANSVTPSPSTLPAHTSLLTGLYPIHHGARANGTFHVEERVVTLAERLHAAGYRTGAVISAFVLDSRFGLDQGFELYHDDLTKGLKHSTHMFRERPAELANEPAVAWLREHAGERFFLWVHYFDPHAAYLPPEPFRREYKDDLYDGEIAYADSQIGALLAELGELGALGRTLVVYTADHGEGLGQHGEQTHSLLTYDTTLRVPLIFSAPAHLPGGRVVRRQAALVDVVPTVLALLGLDSPEPLDGESLIAPPPDRPRSVYFETIATMTLHGWAPLMGVRREDYKYVLAPTPELYDLRADPGETENLHDERPAVAKALREELDAIVGRDPLVAASLGADLPADEETRRHLAELGYLQTVRPGAGARLDLDPKQMVHHWEKLQGGINLREQGQMDQALPILEECVAAVPGDLFARNVLAGTYQMRGEYEKALEILRRSAEMEPGDEGIHLGIANAHMAKGESDEAEAAVRKALEIEPESAGAVVVQGRLALARGRDGEALDLFEQAIEMDPGTTGPGAWNLIGWVHLRANRLEEARQAYQSAIRIDELDGGAREGLANVLIAEEKLDEAEQMLAAALRFDPNQPLALSTLAYLASRKGDQARALEVARRALELAPKFAEAHNAMGLVQRRLGDQALAEEHYKKAIEYGPYLDKPHVNLAQLYVRQGKLEAAMEEFRAALRANRLSKVALVNLGAHHFNEGRVDEAFRLYRRALRVDPSYALAHKNLGSIYLLRGELAKAAHHLRRSLELDPRQPEAEEMRYHLVRAEKAIAAAPAGGADGPEAAP
jgi:arylsulfatase A-like enzyme/Flp pilus assembly protein TadD